MSGHTTGPWVTVDLGTSLVICPAMRQGEVAVISNDLGTNGDANARLIAAAPDLLAALEAVHAHYREPHCLEALVPVIRAAIAKATNGTERGGE